MSHFLYLVTAVVMICGSSLYSQEENPELTVEKIYFYNVRGLAVKEFLVNSLSLDKEKGETITLGMDPERDRLKDSNSGGGGGNPFISVGGSSSERELYQQKGGFLIISAPSKKIELAKMYIAQIDALPAQIQIETFIIKVDKEKLRKQKIDVSGVINSVLDFSKPFADPTLGANTLQWLIGNQINDAGLIRLEDLEKHKFIEVSKQNTQHVIHGETTSLISGERIIFSISSGLSSSIQPIDVALDIRVTPQFIAETERGASMDTLRLDISIEDATARTNSEGTVNKIDRLNLSQPIYVRNGEIHSLGTLVANRDEDENSGIPILRSIPLIGGLFGGKAKQESHAETFVFMRATHYDIFSEAETTPLQDQYQTITEGLNRVFWVEVGQTIVIQGNETSDDYRLEFSKEGGRFWGRILKNGELFTSPMQIRADWHRSGNPVTSLRGTRNFFTTLITLGYFRNGYDLLSISQRDGAFDTHVTDWSTTDWLVGFTFHEISSKGQISDSPFLIIGDIEMEEIYNRVR